MCSSGENLWSTPKSVVSPAGPPTNTTASSVRSHTSRGWRGDGGEEAGEWVRALCCLGGRGPPPSSSALLLGGAGISVQTAAVSSMRSSCENLWSASKSVVSPAGPPTANRAVRGSPGRAAWLAPRRCPPLRRRVAADLTVLPGDGRARVFEKRKGSPLLTAQSIDLRRASDPRIERVADRLGRSALIDQRQRDARVSGSLYALCVEGKGRLTWIMVTSL